MKFMIDWRKSVFIKACIDSKTLETPPRFNGLFQALADWKINFVLKNILTFSYEFVVSLDFVQVFMY